jgi:plastocyanin
MRRIAFALLALAVPSAAVSLGAQAVLDRTPNLGGTWVPDPGVVQFNFIHRFYVGPKPSYSVLNSPTFTFALGLPRRLALGTRYSTRSDVPGDDNEIEVYARWKLLEQGASPVSVSLTPAWNGSAKSTDGEASVDWTRGRFTLSGAARAMSNAYHSGRARTALGGGAIVRLNSYVAVGGDIASLINRDSSEKAAWSVGLLFVIPGSPHTFSLHASNVDVNTIEGSSKKGYLPTILGKTFYGFEFTIPLHLKRFSPWFHKTPKPVALGSAAGAAIVADVRISNVTFMRDTITVAAGQAVRWTNADPIEHTVTFDGAAEPGSPVIPANGSYVHRFDKPGTYVYHCTPHPFMKGVVVVK